MSAGPTAQSERKVVEIRAWVPLPIRCRTCDIESAGGQAALRWVSIAPQWHRRPLACRTCDIESAGRRLLVVRGARLGELASWRGADGLEVPLPRVVNRLGQDARGLLGGVEPHRVFRVDKIEPPLRLSLQ